MPTSAIPRPPLSSPLRIGRNRALDHFNNQNGSFKPPLASQPQAQLQPQSISVSATNSASNDNGCNHYHGNSPNSLAQRPENLLWAHQLHVENRSLAARFHAFETQHRDTAENVERALRQQIEEKVDDAVKGLRGEMATEVARFLPRKEFEEVIKKVDEAYEQRAHTATCLLAEQKNHFDRHIQAIQKNYETLLLRVQQIETELGGNQELLKQDLIDTKAALQKNIQSMEETHSHEMSALREVFHAHVGDLKQDINKALEIEKEARLVSADKHQQIDDGFRTHLHNHDTEIQRFQRTIESIIEDVKCHLEVQDTMSGKLAASLQQVSTVGERMSIVQTDLTMLRDRLIIVDESIKQQKKVPLSDNRAQRQASCKASPSQAVLDGITNTKSLDPQSSPKSVTDIHIQRWALRSQHQSPSPGKSLSKALSSSSSKSKAPSRHENDDSSKSRNSSSYCITIPQKRKRPSVVPESSPSKVTAAAAPSQDDEKIFPGPASNSMQPNLDSVEISPSRLASLQFFPSSQHGHKPIGDVTNEDESKTKNSIDQNHRRSPSCVPESSFRVSQDQENFSKFPYTCNLIDMSLEKEKFCATGEMTTLTNQQPSPKAVLSGHPQCTRQISRLPDEDISIGNRMETPNPAKKKQQVDPTNSPKRHNEGVNSTTPLNQESSARQRKKTRKRRRVIPLVWTDAEEG